MTAVSPLRAAWLLACLRLRRLANLMLTRNFGKKRKEGARAATPAKRRLGGILALFVAVAMLFTATNMAWQSVLHMHCGVSPGSECALAAKTHEFLGLAKASEELHEHGVSEPLARMLAVQLCLLLAVSILVPLGSRELANTDGDLEWLVTLPVTRKTLLAARVAERSIANPVGWIVLLPPCLVTAWFMGFRWSVPLIGFSAAAVLLPVAAVLRTVIDTGLRMRLSPGKLRNLQALCSVGSLPFMYLAMSFAMPAGDVLIRTIGPGLPRWLLWTPPGLAINAITAGSFGASALAAAVLVAQVALFVLAGLWLLGRQLRHGVVASGVRESGRLTTPARRATASQGAWRRLLPHSPIQRRELRLLGRDRNFLVQSLLMPVVIVGSQVILNGQAGSIGKLAASPVALALTAWGITAYMLMLSALQTLNNEGQALWMLYTFPVRIEEVLKDKAKMWAGLALVYPAIILALGFGAAPELNWRLGASFAIVLLGVPVFSAIAVALGVFASDPLAQDVRTRVRPSYVYLYMLLSGMYAYAIYAEKWFQAVVVMVLTALLAQALWQKARDALPYLLDPAAAPPPRVSTADGMIAAMLFFVLQVLGFQLFTRSAGLDDGYALLVAFLGAGAIVYGLVRLVYWRTKTAGVPRLLAGRPLRSVAWGLGGGVVAACAGLAYLHVLHSMPWFVELAKVHAPGRMQAGLLLVLAVVLAPLCEEFMFRGLVFGGLRRSMGPASAIVMSAALFAIVHPPVSMLPVFVLGLCTAFVYERTKGLLAPMLAHAIYNAIVVSSQM